MEAFMMVMVLSVNYYILVMLISDPGPCVLELLSYCGPVV